MTNLDFKSKNFYELNLLREATYRLPNGNNSTIGKQFTTTLSIIERKLIALETIKELFGFDFAIRFGSNQPILMITNKITNEYWEIPLTQEEYDLLKEVLL